MALTQQRKQELISGYQVHETDTGSADVQIAMLTDRINRLSQHLQANKKDHSSRRGLLKMIGQRKRLLAYIQAGSQEKYKALNKYILFFFNHLLIPWSSINSFRIKNQKYISQQNSGRCFECQI